jgi:hypothetical protein
MSEPFLPAFIARWSKLRERYLANPEEHGVKHVRLAKLWRKFDGRCHLCGGHVPHPILELDQVTDDNAPTADHVTPRVDGGGPGKNLKLAHRWCNGRRGRRPAHRPLKRVIRVEAMAKFGQTEAHA